MVLSARRGRGALGALLGLLGLGACERPCDDACHREAAVALAPTDWEATLGHVRAVVNVHERTAAVLAVARVGGLSVTPAEGSRLCALSPVAEVQRQCADRFARPHMQRALDGRGAEGEAAAR